jgi:hypothetical protein
MIVLYVLPQIKELKLVQIVLLHRVGMLLLVVPVIQTAPQGNSKS